MLYPLLLYWVLNSYVFFIFTKEVILLIKKFLSTLGPIAKCETIFNREMTIYNLLNVFKPMLR